MRIIKEELNKKIINESKLLECGFIKKDNVFYYEKNILDDEFRVVIETDGSVMKSYLIENAINDEYLMVDIDTASGEYIGKIKEEYKKEINSVIQSCTDKDVFAFSQSKEVIQYITNKYGDELEFLWEKFENDAIWRNKRNNKWYALLLKVEENRLGIISNREIEVLDIRYYKGKTHEVIDYKKVFPGYHMNKNSWITLKLDGSVNIKEIFKYIDLSYEIVNSNN